MATAKPTDPPPSGDTPPAAPAGDAPSDEQLTAAVENAARRLFDEWRKDAPAPSAPAAPSSSSTPAAPASSSSSGADGLDDKIAAAVRAALDHRDQEDALTVLHDEVERLKGLITSAPAERKAGWGRWILGPGLSRR